MTDRLRILVVDDDSQITRLLTTVLTGEATRYERRRRRVGARAGRRVETRLVLTDLFMPHMNGVELCRRVRVISRVPITSCR